MSSAIGPASKASGKGGKGGTSLPAAPPMPTAPEFGATPQELIDQQAITSILNTSGPFGSSAITGSAEEGFTRETTLAPEVQALYTQLLNPGAGQEYSQAYYDRAASLMEPGRQAQRDTQEANLAARGLPVGSELRSDIESATARQFGEADERLALSSILEGENQQARDFQQFLQLAGGVQGAQGPNINALAPYQMEYQAATLPYLQEIDRQNLLYGAETGSAMQDAANKAQMKSGLLSGAGSVGGAAMMSG